MLQVFLAKNGLLDWDAPVNAQRLILDVDSSISLRMVELIALVLEDGRFGEDGKAMGETSRNKELTMVVLIFTTVKKLKP